MVIKFEESNIAGIGSEEDKKLRELAARGETDFIGCGEAPGLKVFQIQKFDAVPLEEKDFGTFYSGDAYIVLNTYKAEGSENLLHDIHFWLGAEATQDEIGAAAIFTVNLDDYLKGLPKQYREVQGNESEKWAALFPAMKILAGGTASGFTKAEGHAEVVRLYQVTKTGASVAAVEVGLDHTVDQIMASGDIFVLETADKIYQINAPGCSPFEKNEAAALVQKLENLSPHEPEGIVVEGDDIATSDFVKYLGSGGSVLSSSKASTTTEAKVALWKIANEGGEISYTEVPLSDHSVSQQDIFAFVKSAGNVAIKVGEAVDDTEKFHVKYKLSDILGEIGASSNARVEFYGPAENDAWDALF